MAGTNYIRYIHVGHKIGKSEVEFLRHDVSSLQLMPLTLLHDSDGPSMPTSTVSSALPRNLPQKITESGG